MSLVLLLHVMGISALVLGMLFLAGIWIGRSAIIAVVVVHARHCTAH